MRGQSSLLQKLLMVCLQALGFPCPGGTPLLGAEWETAFFITFSASLADEHPEDPIKGVVMMS